MVSDRLAWTLVIAAVAALMTTAARAEACPLPPEAAPQEHEMATAVVPIEVPAPPPGPSGAPGLYTPDPSSIHFSPPPRGAEPRLDDGSPAETDHVIFTVLGVTLLGFLFWYKREQEPDSKLRIAAAAGLWALVFWSCSTALPWLGIIDPDTGLRAMCFLGAEQQCSTYFPEHARQLAGPAAESHMFEIQRWHHAVLGIRAGQSIALFFLLPSLIWLLIDPRSRLALSAAAMCGFATAFALLASAHYWVVVPSWLDVTVYRSFDVAVLSSAAIVVSVALVVVNAMRTPQPKLPSARALR